jgi:hypothetical protein
MELEEGTKSRIVEIAEPEAEEAQPAEQNSSEEALEANEIDQDEEELIVTAGDETPKPTEEEPAPKWVREVRKQNRELQRQNRELQQKLQASAAPVENKPIEVGKKPTLADHDYDEEKFEASLASWFERKRKADEASTQVAKAQEAQQKAWQSRLDAYSVAKTKLKAADFEDAEHNVRETFDVTQQGVVLQGSDNAALVFYYLGKNPDKAKELASIKDPVKFSFAVARLESQLKVTGRKTAPPAPEKTIRTGGSPTANDSTLERLRAEAEKTGDYTKVFQYKRAKAK